MARTSKKRERKTEMPFLRMEGRGLYFAGIYARLSVDSHNEKNESIETQLEIARAWMESQPDISLYACYSDLGKSGTNFEREGFHRMMEDIRLRRVNCVIVKDFSRFGRDYIETGNYIQRIFPFLGVRFIAVTDRFDSLYAENDDLGMNLKNLINEMYAKDISVKVKCSKRMQWENGSYTGGIAPYGYRAEWIDGKKRLLAEDNTAKIVKEIYGLYDAGRNMKEIAAWLYEKKVHRPRDCRLYGHAYAEEGESLLEWPAGSLKLILTNPVYTGCLARPGSGDGERLRQKEGFETVCLIKENTHEAIVDREQFRRIAERFERQTVYGARKAADEDAPSEADIFEGLVYCGCCGKRMGRIRSGKKKLGGYAYYCRNSYRIDEQKCEKNVITGITLLELTRSALKREVILSGVEPDKAVRTIMEEAEKQRKELLRTCGNIRKKMDNLRRKESDEYIRYRNHLCGRQEFLDFRKESEMRIRKEKESLETLEGKAEKLDAAAAYQAGRVREMLECPANTWPEQAFIAALVKKIKVYPDRRAELFFNFMPQAKPYGRAGEIQYGGRKQNGGPED